MQETDGTSQIVAFTVAGVDYAFPISHVKEIIRFVAPQPTSSTTPWMLGVINLRGSIVPIIDLGTRLGRQVDAAPRTDAKILILEHGDIVVGAVVTSVDEVRTVTSDQVLDAPAGAQAGFVDGVVTVDERLIMLLDAEAIVDLQSGRAAA